VRTDARPPTDYRRAVFEPLITERLIVRTVEIGDIDALFERRNEPAVARLQAWALPYPRERAESVIANAAAVDAPQDEQWWMATVVERASGAIVGDLVVHLTNGARTGEVGYSLASAHWGRGFAVEALSALVAWLFDALPVTRLEGRLHPDNRASAMVLERTGFVFEGHTRLSFWLGDDNSDDWIYGMTRADWEAWRGRPTSPPNQVGLVPVTLANKAEVLGLRTHRSQEAFVAPMARSFADALLPEEDDGAPLDPWLRAIEADGTTVGFTMLALPGPHLPEPYLWRLLIDRMHQRRGIGVATLVLLAEECRSLGARAMDVSWAEGKGSPRPFYERLGFVPTGRLLDGETEARLLLGPHA
jgi:RimJ/RimL family protein N-acetyltransferase/ribosomal protein S18 acetylase RimI-like enzyme